MTEEFDDHRNNGRNADGTFTKGNKGRPKGSRHRVSILAEKLMSDDVEKVTKSVIDTAVAGDMAACRLILDRIAPARKDATISIELPVINTIEDAANAMRVIVSAASNAEIGLSEADALTKLVQGAAQAIELTDVVRRLEALEQRSGVH